MREAITLQGLICRNEAGYSIETTLLGLVGTGKTIAETKISTLNLVLNHLTKYIQQNEKLPTPDAQLSSIEEVAEYFSDQIPGDKKIVLTEIANYADSADQQFPVVTIEFYSLINPCLK